MWSSCFCVVCLVGQFVLVQPRTVVLGNNVDHMLYQELHTQPYGNNKAQCNITFPTAGRLD